jgi:hypothetical protein
MAKTIVYGPFRPDEEVITWFDKHIGPRTHWLPRSIGGKGWRFEVDVGHWNLTVEDEKMLMYWTLMRD